MPKVDSKKFFQEQSSHSKVKADLVFKYVTAWAKIVVFALKKAGKPQQAAYIDLFSGPGSYEDGSRSTPLLIIEKLLNNEISRNSLQTFFNDENPAFITSLKQEVGLIPGVESLRHAPRYQSESASVTLFESFARPKNVPVFVFLDQFGYSEVMPDLISRIFRHEKCDCAFFFRTSRVIAGRFNLCRFRSHSSIERQCWTEGALSSVHETQAWSATCRKVAPPRGTQVRRAIHKG